MFRKHRERLLNISLRLASLAAKLGLTLYMGKYLSLADIGIYGLVFGIVMTAGCVMGLRFDYVISREIVGIAIAEALHKMRDQAVFYGINYLIGGIAIALFVLSSASPVSGKILFFILAITIAENFATMTYINLNSMGHQIMANLLFFARSGLWTFPVMALGVLIPACRDVDTILTGWLCGVVVCIGLNFWIWRAMPWRAVMRTPVDWRWIRQGLKKCLPIWLGAMGLTIGGYLDRFVVDHFLGIEKVGIATFYFSFVTALFTLIQSGVLSFTYPKLISLHREKNQPAFWQEVRQAFWHVGLFAGIIALGIGIGVPLLGTIFHRPEFAIEAPTLWLMLVAVWIRANAETLYYVLFARHQDRAIWLGNILFLIPAFGFNALLVPLIGLPGIGYGSLIAMSSLFLWRWWHIRHHDGDEQKPAPVGT